MMSNAAWPGGGVPPPPGSVKKISGMTERKSTLITGLDKRLYLKAIRNVTVGGEVTWLCLRKLGYRPRESSIQESVVTLLIDTVRYTPTEFAKNYDKIAGARERRGKRFALMSGLDKPFNVATESNKAGRKKRGTTGDRRFRARTFVSKYDENQTLWIRPVGTTVSKQLTTDALRGMLEVKFSIGRSPGFEAMPEAAAAFSIAFGMIPESDPKEKLVGIYPTIPTQAENTKAGYTTSSMSSARFRSKRKQRTCCLDLSRAQ
jgi:hypothetical protein